VRAALAILSLALAPWPPEPRAQTAAAASEIEAFVARANAAADEYMRTFRGLTAEETKVIEILNARGGVDKRREIVSDLLVYQTARAADVVEYRDVLSVDGRTLERRGERALALLTRASREETIQKELEAVNRETWRYEFRRHVRNFTIGQFKFPAGWQQTYDIALEGHELVDGHDSLVVRYRERVAPPRSSRPLPLPREFGNPPRLWQGRAWLDAETGQLRRSIRELAARHPAAAEPLVLVRADARYAASRFGILVPDRLVFEWLDRFSHPKGAPPSFALNERATFTYGNFKRFDVATSERIDAPR
jgi:hypothetical protein